MYTMLIVLLTLFARSFFAATVLPLGSEAPLVAYVRAYEQVVIPVLVATAGNYLGACTTYWLGRSASQSLGKEQAAGENQSRGAELLRRFGQPVLLFSWVPILGDALVALSGAMSIHFPGQRLEKVSLLTTALTTANRFGPAPP